MTSRRAFLKILAGATAALVSGLRPLLARPEPYPVHLARGERGVWGIAGADRSAACGFVVGADDIAGLGRSTDRRMRPLVRGSSGVIGLERPQ